MAQIFILTRLNGHGRDGDALADAALGDWLNDVSEAMAIGEQLGKKIILVSVSTGGTLSTWAAAQPQFANTIHAHGHDIPQFCHSRRFHGIVEHALG